MMAFTELEQAALHSIFSETPELAANLERQLNSATVTARENTGGGFFTTISVSDDAPPVNSPKVLCNETQARLNGIEHGLGFVLFMDGGKLHLLEGFAWGPESTASLILDDLTFEVYKAPVPLLS